MADFTLPKPRRRYQPDAQPALPVGRSQGSQSGVDGFLARLPGSMGAGTPAYQAGLDQSREGELSRNAFGMADQMLELRRAQERSLQEHKQYREGLNAAQQQVNTRNNDLRLAQNLLIATDPRVDKSVRKFMLEGLSNAAGVDPKGEYSQSIQKMVLGMQPEGLEALRSSFGDDITNAPPGAIQQQLNGIFSGATPVENVIAQVKQHQDAKAAAMAGLTSPGLPLTSGAPASGVAPVPEGGVAEATAELAGGATVAPSAAPPSAQQRQAVIAAAGLTDGAPTAPQQAAPAEAASPPEVAPPQEVGPPSPIPETSATTPPPGLSDAPTATAPPAETPAPVETPAPPAAAGQAPGVAPVTPPPQETPQPIDPMTGLPLPKPGAPPEPTSRMEVPDSLRKAAEETGDKLLLDAIAKIDARNAVIDSDAHHRRTFSVTGPPLYHRPKLELPSGPTKVPGSGITARVGTGGRTAEDGLPLGPGGEVATKAQEALDTVRDNNISLSPEEYSVLRMGATYGAGAELSGDVSEVRKIIPKGSIEEITTPKSAGEIQQEYINQNNEFARRNPAPANPNPEALKPEERPLPDQEVHSAVKMLGITKPGERTVMRDVERVLPALPAPTDKEGNQELAKAVTKWQGTDIQLYGSAADISKTLRDPAGAAAVGGVDVFGMKVTPGTVSRVVEGAASLLGLNKDQMTSLNNVVKEKVAAWGRTQEGKLTSDQIAIASAKLEAQLSRFAFAVAAAQNPRGTISTPDVEAAKKNVGSIDMTAPQIHAVLADILASSLRDSRTDVASRTGAALGPRYDSFPDELRKQLLAEHAASLDTGASVFNPNEMRDVAQSQRDADAKRQGLPERENKYIASSGGTRPEDYDRATSKQAATAREQKEETLKHTRQQIDLEQKKWEMDQEKWDYKKEEDRKREARQAMLDARHAQEKMAQAFQHIGAMVAGAVKGGSVGGGSGISAGGEDTSAFRIAPSPQRRAPQVGGVQPPTRYGGPIKRGK